MDECCLNLTTQLDLGNVEVDIMWLTAGSAYPCQSQGESEGLMVVEGENVVCSTFDAKTPSLTICHYRHAGKLLHFNDKMLQRFF